MSIGPAMYMHDSDKAALKALQAIPGFTPALKAFMKVWNEQQFRIVNMSSNLRLGPQQMPEYYNMLLPICEKLGIEVPELYLKLDVRPNAYTYGDTKPFIVITSGLLENMPADLIPTVLAHECGHIACRHTLYTTMGTMLINRTIGLLGLGDLASLPLQIAFYYWMRCSEYSADRAAVICDDGPDKVIRMCMHFSGFDKDLDVAGDVNAFMDQAMEYREMVNDSKWNKALEFAMFAGHDHPLTAVRAYECRLWGETESFSKIQQYLAGEQKELPCLNDAKYYLGRDVAEVLEELQGIGFSNIDLIAQKDKTMMKKPGQVLRIMMDGREKFQAESWYSADSQIVITYYAPEGPNKQ